MPFSTRYLISLSFSSMAITHLLINYNGTRGGFSCTTVILYLHYNKTSVVTKRLTNGSDKKILSPGQALMAPLMMKAPEALLMATEVFILCDLSSVLFWVVWSSIASFMETPVSLPLFISPAGMINLSLSLLSSHLCQQRVENHLRADLLPVVDAFASIQARADAFAVVS